MRKKFRLILGAAALTAAVPLLAQPRGDEPIAVPSNIKQGVDFVYVDPEMSSVAIKQRRPRNWLQRIFGGSRDDNRSAPNPMFLQLSDGLNQYMATWGSLPQNDVAAGGSLKLGATGARVRQLRTRLGLVPAGNFDQVLQQRVRDYQTVHALDADGIAGRATIASLNSGAEFYERKIAINMERAWRLPATRAFDRYVVIDSGDAMAYLYDRDRMADSMRVVVGTNATKTPMMAVLMRNAKSRPYWHVPPALVRTLTAKRIQEQGLTYLRDFHYEVLSDWRYDAPLLDPKSVNWASIANGRTEPNFMVRQLPGPWNSMGEMKFEMPNDFGVYLHDTPHKELFAEENRHLSNGCVRLEDYRRFASWVFGRMPQVTSAPEQILDLPRAMPVYFTYLTAEPAVGNGVVFRPDPYGFDALAMPQMDFGRRS